MGYPSAFITRFNGTVPTLSLSYEFLHKTVARLQLHRSAKLCCRKLTTFRIIYPYVYR